ncbi:hypothetical protein [Pandoravirus japonicus]|uniref:Uncharacterized protein n=1 Tax=Pandoravirus japonicus TaxID=2823154 RepID=A0A811BPU9_9VIRU|nr:hypothetical protein [Pandoravirus japonicus]
MASLTATVPLEPANPNRGDDKDDACNPRHKGQADPFTERVVDATDDADPADTAHALAGGADPGHAADDYDATGASYAALFDDGGLFSEFIAGHDQDFWDNADMMITTTTATTASMPTSTLDRMVDAATQGLPYASVSDAVDALLATCPRQASCKPATLALPRAPMVYVIKRHMRDHGGVDFGPAAGGPCATLDEACKRIDGLGPCDMLDRGVMAWVAGRLMDHVRPGSSHGIPVTPLSRIGTLVQREFGSGEWILEDPESLDERFERPEHASLRALIAWTVDSARTVAVLRARASVDETAARQPAGKDYTKGPLKRLAKERDAYERVDATDSDVWAAFLLEQSKADEVRHTKKRRRLARTHPGPDVATAATAAETVDQKPPRAPRAPSKTTKAAARSRKSGRAALTLSLPQGGAPPSAALFAPPPVPPPIPPVQSPPPTSLDITALDRHVLAQIQSFALMSLAAAGPAGIAAGAPVTFMAPSVSCPGTMALTCWVTVPPDAESDSDRPKPRASGERPRKRHKRSRKAPTGRGPADAAPAGALNDTPLPPPQPPPLATPADDRDGADPASGVREQVPAGEPLAEAAPPSTGATPPHGVLLYASADVPKDTEAARPCSGTDSTEAANATEDTTVSTEDETIDQGVAQPRAFMPVDDDTQASDVPMAVDMPRAECNSSVGGMAVAGDSSSNNYDLDQLLAAEGDDDWDDLLACGRLPCA